MSDLDFDGPIPGEPFLMRGAFDLDVHGYRVEEWFVSGEAKSYELLGERGGDGRWDSRAAGSAGFKTRIAAIRPNDPARFNGTVIVEWMNVSGGIDACPDWMFVHRHLMREGAAWVGVSAQRAGIDGGGLVPGLPLKQHDADRYGSLLHPGDAFAFDIFGQVGAAMRGGADGPLGDLAVRCLLGIGESQSAAYLVTYINAADPLAPVYDGLLVHGRPATAAALDGNYMRAAADGDVSKVGALLRRRELVRDDARIPVLVLQSETDLMALGSVMARQPDSERFRLWEIAGAAHYDTYGLVATHSDNGDDGDVSQLAKAMAPTDSPMGMQADSLINSGPQQHYIAQAALAALDRWVREGVAPAEAARLETQGEPAEFVVDSHGNARGGVRTPWVDAPTAQLTGRAPGGEGFLFLFGTTELFDDAKLRELYPGGPNEHRARFDEATAAAVEAGFLLEADADEIRALARCGIRPSGF